MHILSLLILLLFSGCNFFSISDEIINDGSKIFVTLQDSDYIAIVRSSDLAILDTI